VLEVFAQRYERDNVKTATLDRFELIAEGVERGVEPNLLPPCDDVVPYDDGDVGRLACRCHVRESAIGCDGGRDEQRTPQESGRGEHPVEHREQSCV
jgi:hypothetical protein